MKFLLTCEHGGNEIPLKYKALFESSENTLNTHRGYDPGALNLFKKLEFLSDFSRFSTTSRLLIELNRSLHHPDLFSEFTRNLSGLEKGEIIYKYYSPYRDEVENKIESWILEGEKVLHLSVHSFTPVLKNVIRNTDVGLLYDPARAEEKLIAARWKEKIKSIAPGLKVRFNYPYKGTADGFTTYLRKKFPENYIGIELEVNQKFSTANDMDPKITACLETVLKEEIKKKTKR